MLDRLFESLGRQSQTRLSYLALALAAILGYVDYVTGFDISFGVFYLIPVSIGAWYVSFRFGVVMSFLTAVVWLTSNSLTEAGQQFSVLISVWNATTRLGFFLVTSILLSRLRSALEREKAMARVDSLTGVLNLRAFDEAARIEIHRAKRLRQPLTLMFLDLDNFKEVNDRYGHARGDELLQEIARILLSNLRLTDVIARLGGDEFAILAPNTGEEAAGLLSRKLCELLSVETARFSRKVTCSMGVLTYEEPADDLKQMLKQADRLMYGIKTGGKDGVSLEVVRATRGQQ